MFAHRRPAKMIGPAMTVWVAVVAVVAVMLAAMGGSVPVHAEDTTAGEQPPKLALVMDASGSMAETDVTGGTRMDAAKSAATGMVNDLGDDTELTFIAYGATVSDDDPANKAQGCQDIEVLQDLKPLDRESTIDEINGLEPTGYTPIGESLKTAADELGNDAPRSIVLVSDGIDTCAPPPVCEVAQQLADDGVDLSIHTVGFKVDGQARADLECVAEATGGSYAQADDTDQLSSTLSLLAKRFSHGYETSGTDISLPPELKDAQYLGEGAYLATLPSPTKEIEPGADRWFKLAVPEGYTAHVTATIIPPQAQGSRDFGDIYGVNISATNATCDESETSTWVGTRQDAEAPEASSVDLRTQEGCDPDEWEVALQRTGTVYEQELPVEIVIGLEPDAPDSQTGPEDPHAHEDQGTEVAALNEDRPATSVTGGTSYSTATEIQPGTLKDSIVPGETRFYRIPVEWGQRPVAKMEFGPVSADNSPNATVEIASPLRHKAGSQMPTILSTGSATSKTNTDAYWAYYSNNPQGSSSYRETYQKDAAYAGDWYVMVTLNGGANNAQANVEEDYELTVLLDGEPVEGPGWTMPVDNGPEPADTPIQPAGASDSTGSNTPEASGGASTSTDGDSSDSGESIAASDDTASGSAVGLGRPVLVAIGAGIGLLVIGGITAAVLRARRRNHR